MDFPGMDSGERGGFLGRYLARAAMPALKRTGALRRGAQARDVALTPDAEVSTALETPYSAAEPCFARRVAQGSQDADAGGRYSQAIDWRDAGDLGLAGETILDALPVMVAVCGEDGSILAANARFAGFCGRERETLADASLGELIGGDFVMRLSSPFRQAFFGQPSRIPEFAAMSGSREALIDIAFEPLKTASGTIAGVIFLAVEAGEGREAEPRLSPLREDQLTGILSRAAFQAHLERMAAAGCADGALLIVDLDNFRMVNDLAGHGAGDALLRQVARMLCGLARQHDALAARLDGDEFALFAGGLAGDEAQEIGHRVVAALQSARFTWEGACYGIDCSVGVALFDGMCAGSPAALADDLLRRAARACRVAKDCGGGRVAVFRPGNAAMAACHEDLGNLHTIQDALDANRLHLFTMPIEAIDGSGRMHHEVLLRVGAGDGGLLAPAPLIAAAERYGLMPRIDRWVVCSVLRRLEAERSAGVALRHLTVNLSGHSVGDADFKDYLIAKLDAAPHLAGQLSFEITETAAVRSLATAQDLIGALRARGCSVILDDFGAGLSSFAYLKQFRIDGLKIDGAIIGDISRDEVQQTIVAGIVAVAEKLGVAVIAEFVEDAETLDVLRRLGVTHAQGYYIGRPEEWVASQP